MAWELSRSVTPEPARPPEPVPARHPGRGAPSPAALLALQRSAGNSMVAGMLQRMTDRSADFGPGYVEFTQEEKDSGQAPSMAGNLASDPDHRYVRDATKGDLVYRKEPKKGAGFKAPQLDDAEKERQRKEGITRELGKVQPTLFDGASGGGVEGSFEYVANYLYSEVYGADRAKAAGFWNQVWSVAEPPEGGDPVRTRLPGFDQKRLLQEMIDEGLDATWKAIPVQELVKVKAGTAEPAKSMKVIQREAWDYLAAISNWTPWPETSGVGFHTTDGAPGQVAQDKGAGGWGGITRTITVPFFKQRYGLGQDWNPLGTWLEEKGPTFRKGIKDNELLSTVSVATASHGSVRFPLADTPGRRGTHKVRHAIAGAEQDTFHMQVYMYVVRVGSGYATFAKQGEDAFGEIATGDIPIEDIIGWTKIERWHPYADPVRNVPLTIGFEWTMEALTTNPGWGQGGIRDRILAVAQQEINAERANAGTPYAG